MTENIENKPEPSEEPAIAPDAPEAAAATPEASPEAPAVTSANPPADFPLNIAVRAAQTTMESNFIFRKLGLCYDYAAPEGSFPLPSLPTFQDIRDGKPNLSGMGTGMAFTTRNGGLLFDGYLLRVELGIADPSEDRIFDRLIGGLIRIATIGQKSFLVRGLIPDGRGHYAQSDPDSHLFWAWSALRGYKTPAIAQESQEKICNIVGKWVQRLFRDEWKITNVQGEQSGAVDLAAINWKCGPRLLALVAIAATVTGNPKWWDVYKELSEENGKARLNGKIPADQPRELLPIQLAFHILADLDKDEARQVIFRKQMKEIADAAAPLISGYKELKPQILEEVPDLDWHKLPDGGQTLEVVDPAGWRKIEYPVVWRRLKHERDTVAAPVEAALAVVLAGDKDIAAPHTEAITELLTSVPWREIISACALAPVASLHARGIELGLWESGLLEQVSPSLGEDVINIAQYLAPDYDKAHPDRAGHTISARVKEEPPAPKSNKSRSRGKRRRRKKKA